MKKFLPFDLVRAGVGKRCIAASACPRTARQRGFTLIEVMVALIVLVLGVLGAAAMTLNSLRNNKQSATRSQAVALAYEVADLMRMNPGQENVFITGTGTASATCYTGTGCAVGTLAANDLAEWQAKLATLPGATANICRDQSNAGSMTTCDGLATSPIVVKIQWVEKNNDGSIGTLNAGGGSGTPSLVIPILRN